MTSGRDAIVDEKILRFLRHGNSADNLGMGRFYFEVPEIAIKKTDISHINTISLF